jgi:HEAT repeat protein
MEDEDYKLKLELFYLKAIEPDDRDIPWEVDETLADLGLTSEEILPTLRRALFDKQFSNDIRVIAAEGLIQLEDEQSVEPLIKIILDKNEDVILRARAARGLAINGEERVTEPLISLIKENSENNLIWVIQGLNFIDDLRVYDLLFSLLEHPDSKIRSYTAYSFGSNGERFGINPPFKHNYIRPNYSRSAAKAWAQNGGYERLIKTLLNLLHDNDSEVRLRAIQALGNLEEPLAMEPIIAALKDKNDDVRHIAAAVLGQIGDSCAVNPLIQALGDKHNEVRYYAANSLGRIGNPKALPYLEKLYQNDQGDTPTSGTIKSAAARAIKQIKSRKSN